MKLENMKTLLNWQLWNALNKVFLIVVNEMLKVHNNICICWGEIVIMNIDNEQAERHVQTETVQRR